MGGLAPLFPMASPPHPHLSWHLSYVLRHGGHFSSLVAFKRGIWGGGGGLVQAALGSFIYITSPHLESAEFAISKGWGPPQRRGYHPALHLQSASDTVWTAGSQEGREPVRRPLDVPLTDEGSCGLERSTFSRK